MQERILNHPTNHQSDTMLGNTESNDNERINQLSLEIPNSEEIVNRNIYSQVTNDVLSFDVPTSYPAYHTVVNQPPVFPFTLPVARSESTQEGIRRSLESQEYKLNETKLVKSSFEDESNKSQGNGTDSVIKYRKMSESSDDLCSSNSSSSCLDSEEYVTNNNDSSEDSAKQPRPKNKSTKKKLRTNYTPEQIRTLEKVFQEIPYPDAAKIESLSKDLDIAETKLKIWFQNKRARWRKSAQEKPQRNFMSPFSPHVPQMGPYGVIPPHHSMLHGSPVSMSPSPFFYQGFPFGMQLQPSLPGIQGQQRTFGLNTVPSNQQIMTPSSSSTSGSPVSSLTSSPVSNNSPKTSETGSPQSPKTVSPYHNSLPHVQPYMPFSYPYGVYPPYYC